VNKRLRLDETAAGQFVVRYIQEQRNRSQKEIQDLQDDMREAVAEKNERTARRLAKRLDGPQEWIDRLDQDVRNLRVSFENLKWEREQEFEKILDEKS
jgi:phage shock protein A